MPDLLGNYPLFSIVTVSYNSAKWIKQSIESVLNSSFSQFEYIISDDASLDDSWAIIQSYNDPRIKAFRQERNIGEYPNRNFTLANATGKYLLFVDGDDKLYEDTLSKLSIFIDQYPGAGSLWGVNKNEVNFCNLPVLLQTEEIIQWLYLANIRIAHIGFAETLFKTSLLKSLGGFSTQYIGGDMHMKKLCALEGPVLIIPAGLVYWRVSEGQASSKLLINFNGFRNNVQIDNELVTKIKDKKLDIPVNQIEQNIRIRNIKLLIKHTFQKGKIKAGLRLARELKFRLRDIIFIFKKGDYSYHNNLRDSYKLK